SAPGHCTRPTHLRSENPHTPSFFAIVGYFSRWYLPSASPERPQHRTKGEIATDKPSRSLIPIHSAIACSIVRLTPMLVQLLEPRAHLARSGIVDAALLLQDRITV